MVDELLSDSMEYEKMSKASNPYGDGHASERIVDAIIAKFSKSIEKSKCEKNALC